MTNYSYTPQPPTSIEPYNGPYSNKDPEFFSGAVVDFNIDEDYDLEKLSSEIQRFAQGAGPNLITISTGSRKLLEEARYNTDRDLLRFRQGGWS